MARNKKATRKKKEKGPDLFDLAQPILNLDEGPISPGAIGIPRTVPEEEQYQWNRKKAKGSPEQAPYPDSWAKEACPMWRAIRYCLSGQKITKTDDKGRAIEFEKLNEDQKIARYDLAAMIMGAMRRNEVDRVPLTEEDITLILKACSILPTEAYGAIKVCLDEPIEVVEDEDEDQAPVKDKDSKSKAAANGRDAEA